MSEYITMRDCLKLDLKDAIAQRDAALAECLEQAKLLAMSADREEKLRADLALARKLADSAMLESDRLRARLHKEQA